MQRNDEDIRVMLRKMAKAHEKGIDVDPVFVVMRRKQKRVYEVLLGRHAKIKNDEVSTHLQGNLPRKTVLDKSWKCLSDVFYEYIDVAKAPDLVMVGPPMFVRDHVSFDGRKKLLVYVSVGMPVGTVFACRERPNGFREHFWLQTDEETLRALFEPIRCHAKSTGHLAAALMAQMKFREWHY